MRRTAFYLSVAFFTFGMNSSFLSSCVLAQENAVKNQNKQTSAEECADKEKLKIWETLKKTDYVREQLKGAPETGNCADYIESVKPIDLNDDGQSELFVFGTPKLYAPAASAVWILQKIGEDYRQILQERDVNYKILKESSNGFHDLYFVTRRAPRRFVLSTYQYKNNRYESVKCLVGIPFGTGEQAKLFNCDNEKGMAEFEKANGITNKP